MPNENHQSNIISNWLLTYREIINGAKEKYRGPTIEVSDVAGKLAFIYEKIRNAVDYRDDHLLRKHAIGRILRRFMSPGARGSEISRPLIEELIRARYLGNKTVAESKISEVANAINKIVIIYNAEVDRGLSGRANNNFFIWLINMAACEIEEILLPGLEAKATLDALHRVVRANVIFEGQNQLDETQLHIQIYLAVLKGYIKADEMTANYYLLKYHFPAWRELALSEAEKKSNAIFQAKEIIRCQYEYYLNEKLTREFKRYIVIFWILEEIIKNNPNTFEIIFNNRAKLIDEIQKVCQGRYQLIGRKVRTAIFRSVIYIFLTKMIFGLVLEFPYDYFILRDIFWLPLGINALFPPLLMTLIGLSIRVPKQNNTQAIINEISNIVYGSRVSEHRVKLMKAAKGFGHYLMQALYCILYLISFGAIIYGLSRLHFSLASMIIFLLFLTLVSFFSLRIRKTAGELIILTRRESFLTVIFTFLAIPILRVGRWISLHSTKINVFIYLLDFFIESPYKTFVRIFEDLINFIKEKKDEMM